MTFTKCKKILCVCSVEYTQLCLAYLFVKAPRPADSEGTFSVCESSFHLLLPV